MSSDRPAVPSELRRRVLLESGHRCAIHTCRHPEVDVHHIEPWARVREHRFENLIALCPNCHRLAEGGKVDRPALRAYKARLAAAFRFAEINVYPAEVVLPSSLGWLDPSLHWRVVHLAREGERLEIRLEYPEFSVEVLGPDTKAINELLRIRMEAQAKDFEADVLRSLIPHSALSNTLNSSFGVSFLAPGLVSIRFALHAFSGGAHGSTWSESLNLASEPVRELELTDLFDDVPGALSVLSDYAIDDLLHPKSRERDPRSSEEWVRSGAGPDPENYRCINLTNRGVLVTFNEYQVGPYAEGWSEVHLTYDRLEPFLSRMVAQRVLRQDA